MYHKYNFFPLSTLLYAFGDLLLLPYLFLRHFLRHPLYD